jgi:heptosyltransferase-2
LLTAEQGALLDNVSYAASGVKRLLVFAPNWLGDAIMALPAIADLRRGAPHLTIDVAARPAVAPMFNLVAGIGRVVMLTRRSPLTRDFAADLQGDGYDAALLLPNSFQSALTAWRAGIPMRWGYRTDLRAPLLTTAVSRPGVVHQAAYYQHLTRTLGFASGPLEPRIEIAAQRRHAGAEFLKGSGWDGASPLVALAPGAAYGGAKRWPAESFAAVADGLASDRIATVLIGSAGDRAAGAEVLAAARSAPIDLIGRTDLPSLAGILANCRGLVSNDSGAMHFASAIGVRVTAMFGPTEEWATRPLGRIPPTVLIHDVWCRPCMLRECPIDHRCMRGITVAAVLAAARQS